LLNSQFPYNQLPHLQQIVVAHHPLLQQACRNCWNSLYQLHGFIDAFPAKSLQDDLMLLQITEAKFSFELDNRPISFTRLFEAFSSENLLGDEIPKTISNYISWYRTNRKISLEALKPVYAQLKKRQSLFRDKKEISVRSYHTNLALYTAPDHPGILRSLKEDLDHSFHNHHSHMDELVQMSLCHFQIRALSPYNELNHHVARSYTQLWLKSQNFNFVFLPISKIIYSSREKYQALMREVANSKNYEDWCIYLIDTLNEAALYTIRKLKEIQSLKKATLELMAKYTEYHLPANELLPVIFSRPFLKPKYLTTPLHCHRHTAYAYLGHLVKAGILIEKKSGREKLYLHKQLFDVLSN
jgi:Fic family protein